MIQVGFEGAVVAVSIVVLQEVQQWEHRWEGSRADPSSSVLSRSLTWLSLTWLVSPECCLMVMLEAGQEGWQCCVPSQAADGLEPFSSAFLPLTFSFFKASVPVA